MSYVIVPGIGGSGETHWQSIWESDFGADAVRMRPGSWDAPDLTDWLSALTSVVTPGSILVAHSLGCLAAASWLVAHPGVAAGAFFVAPPDPSGPEFPAAAAEFDVVAAPVGVAALVVVSSNDPYAGLDFARSTAAGWAASLVDVGAQGHLNAASGHGEWAEGRGLLTAFTAGLGRP